MTERKSAKIACHERQGMQRSHRDGTRARKTSGSSEAGGDFNQDEQNMCAVMMEYQFRREPGECSGGKIDCESDTEDH